MVLIRNENWHLNSKQVIVILLMCEWVSMWWEDLQCPDDKLPVWFYMEGDEREGGRRRNKEPFVNVPCKIYIP